VTSTAEKSVRYPLGDRTVNRLGFGGMTLTGPRLSGPPADREAALAVLRRAVELGVDHIDTSDSFGPHVVNELIREALHPYPDDLTIVTKIGPGRDLVTGDWGDWATPDRLRAHVEHNLETLGLDRLHVVNYRSNGRDDVPAAVAALARLREEGLIHHVGLSNVGVEALDAARGVTEIVCVQNRHAPGYERSDARDVLAACQAAAIAFVPFFAIAGQAREEKAEEQYDVIRALAEAYDATPAQIRIAWNLALGPHVLAIPGTGDLGHLEENVAAAAQRLGDEDLAALAGLTSE
jgi:pyridoxine 4-dehydrogenase